MKVLVRRIFIWMMPLAFLISHLTYGQSTVAPADLRIDRDVKPAMTPEGQSITLDVLPSSASPIPVFPAPPCQSGEFYVAIQLNVNLGDVNTVSPWTAGVSVSFLNTNDVSNPVLWTSNLEVGTAAQQYIATVFHASAISCNAGYQVRINGKTLTGAVPQENVSLTVQLYKKHGAFNPTMSTMLNVASNGNVNLVTWDRNDGISSPSLENEGVLEYELEWVYIDDYEGAANITTPEQAFAAKAPVRINTAEKSFRHMAYYPGGKLWYRVRAVGFSTTNPGHRILGTWYYYSSGVTALNHKPDMNWQQQSVFAEEGKYKNVMNYFDGSLRQRQVLTNLSTERLTLVGESFYDYEGRKSVDILPVPSYTAPVTWKNLNQVTAVVDDLIKNPNGQVGWNAGASSVEKLDPNSSGWLDIPAQSPALIACVGLSDVDIDETRATIDYAFFIYLGTVRIMESDNELFDTGPFQPGDLFQIERKDDVIYYRKNGTIVYISSVHSTSELVVDASISTLPGVVSNVSLSNTNSLKFRNDLTQFVAQQTEVSNNTGNGLQKFHYDNAGAINSIVSANSGASWYYSPRNLSTQTHRDYIPDAEGYVYSQVEYLNDGTGRAARQSGVGKEFRMGGSHVTSMYYGTPAQAELSRLFGNNIGNANHYKKILTVDPNGQASVSYLDQEDRTIATALTGVPPGNVTHLDSYTATSASPITVSLTDRNAKQDGKSILTQKFLKSDGTPANYTFEYALSAMSSEVESLGCLSCAYDLRISITKPDGTLVDLSSVAGNEAPAGSFQYERLNLTTQLLDCATPEQLVFVTLTDVQLAEAGDYTITKILTPREKTFEEIKTAITSTTTYQTKVTEIIAAHPADDEDCEICTTCDVDEAAEQAAGEIAVLDCENIYQQILSELLEQYGDDPDYDPEAHPDHIAAHALNCHYQLCMTNKSSDEFEKKISLIETWSDAVQNYPNLVDSDPFFNNLMGYDQNLSGLSKKSAMVTKLQSIQPSPSLPVGTIQSVTDPTNSAYKVNSSGVQDPNGYHILYYNLMQNPQSPSHEENLDKQRWVMYKSFYLEAKRQIKLTINAYATCPAAREELDLIGTAIQLDDFSDYEQPIEGEDPIGADMPVSDEELEASVYSIALACDGVEISPADKTTISGHLRTYFDSHPENFSRIIISADLTTDPDLLAVNAILSAYNCNLSQVAQQDLLTCARDTTVVVPPAPLQQLMQQSFSANSWEMNPVSDSDAMKQQLLMETESDLRRVNSEILSQITETIRTASGKKTRTSALSTLSGCQPDLTLQYQALMALYSSTNGANWTNKTGWSAANPNVVQSVAGWYGVTVDANGYVTSLNLSGNNLTGTIPPEIGNICSLRVLGLSYNNFSGGLPAEIGNLTNLVVLEAVGTHLSGTIPTTITNLAVLQYLELSSNQLTGSIPATIGNLTSLISLNLASNQLSGTLPASLWTMSGLQILSLSVNQFTGSIPSAVSGLSSIQYIYMSSCGISGQIPSELRYLYNLKEFHARNNQLSGSIPHLLSQLANLEKLQIDINQLSGSIPSSLGNLTKLVTLDVSYNQLTGSIPAELGSVTTLTGLFFNNNQLSGSIPVTLSNLVNLQYLYLGHNQLSGTIPSGFTALTKLKGFLIDHNSLQGTVPVIPVVLPAQYQVGVDANRFTFTDFLPAKQSFSGTSFTYTPQDSVDVLRSIKVLRGSNYHLVASVDRSTTPASVFQWFKKGNGGPDIALNTASTSGHTFTLTSIDDPDEGSYFYKITNPGASGLTLISRLQKIQVDTVETMTYCIEFDQTNPTLAVWTITPQMWQDAITACEQRAAAEAQTLIDYATEILIDELATEYYQNSSTNCLELATETFTYSYTSREYHYTLYYYDQSGNLVKTVPPAGVSTAGDDNHDMATYYRYNSLNQLVWQSTPDAGRSQFWYDSKGQLRLSQNAQQQLDGKYSYSRYDHLGRVVEVGEFASSQPLSQLTDQLDNAAFPASASYTLNDVTKTFYDKPNLPMQGSFTQQFLRNRVSWTEVSDNLETTYTYYSYDVHGNVKSLLQVLPDLGLKRTDYQYDLISGKVTHVLYQHNQADQFYHRYTYDADNRIRQVFTSTDGFIWNQDAEYSYYHHGPLARVTLGEYTRVQGTDYFYNLQGWIKGVNMPYGNDPSNDGFGGSKVGRDEFAYALGYYNGDYKPLNASTIYSDTRDQLWARHNTVMSNAGYFNGNIAWMTTDIKWFGLEKNDRSKGVQAMLYKYDQLHRIVQARSLSVYNAASGFAARTSAMPYDETFTYDGNGNILTLQREDQTGTVVDDFHYDYYTVGGKKTNKLRFINPVTNDITYNGTIVPDNKLYRTIHIGRGANVPSGESVTLRATQAIEFDGDESPDVFDLNDNASLHAYVIDETEGLYNYDAIGNLVFDSEQGVTIEWTPYGKVRKVSHANGNIVTFRYDAAGNRIEKRSVDASGNGTLTHYVRDAGGNVMAVYRTLVEEGAPAQNVLAEQPVYGSARLGHYAGGQTAGTRKMGLKVYELSNHLGNVLVVISDQINLQADSAWATVMNATDYYAFGSSKPGRTFTANDEYRYGFNGKEKDDSGEWGSTAYDYGFRIYNPSIGRFLSVDPLTKSYPWYTPYQFAGDNPVKFIDMDGLEPLDPQEVDYSAQTLIIIVQGIGGEPAKGRTQAKNYPTDTPMGLDTEGLGRFQSVKIKSLHIMTFASAKGEQTKDDIELSIMRFTAITEGKGKIVVIGHSQGADNAVEILQKKRAFVDLLITIDIMDSRLGYNDSDNVFGNVLNVINYHQTGEFFKGATIDSWDIEEGTNVVNKEVKGANHRSIDNYILPILGEDVRNFILGLDFMKIAKERKIKESPKPKEPTIVDTIKEGTF